MAKIWYSVFGEGFGHSTRSEVMIEELLKNHQVLITGFNKSYTYLKKRFPKITYKIEGLGFVYDKNEVSIPKTVKQFLDLFPGQSKKNLLHCFNLIKKFNPDLIISDFEPTAHYLAYFLGIPIISINNMSVLSKCKLRIKREDYLDFVSALSVINLFTPRSDFDLLLSFKDFPTKQKNVLLFPPILRKEILKITPKNKNFILIYQTSKDNFSFLINELKQIKEKFIVYGLDENKKDKNIIFRKFSKTGFIKDLSECKAVMMTGGFSTISEAIYLKKPMLIIPAKNQYEQKFNGLTIEEMGLGKCEPEINRERITSFIAKIDYYNKNLSKLKKWDNSEIIKKLEALIPTLKSKPKTLFYTVRKAEALIRKPRYERTLTIVKPDAVEKKVIGEVIKRLEKQQIRPVAMKMIKIKKSQAEKFYSHLKGRIPLPVFNSIMNYMTSNKVILIVWQGNGVVSKVRQVCGPTNPKKAKKSQIRSLSKEDMKEKFEKGLAVRNIIHSSSTIQEAKKEISFFFWPWEIHNE
jgi:uncharacterized protein (TIGR00661 family)